VPQRYPTTRPGDRSTTTEPAPAAVPPRAGEAGASTSLSLCTGAFILAAAGLLDGRRATTHWTECAELARRHPLVTVDPDVLYVDGGDILLNDRVLEAIRTMNDPTGFGLGVASDLAESAPLHVNAR